ncbi:MAG: putative quinol monooxygenase [Thermoguttaceae bacterium]
MPDVRIIARATARKGKEEELRKALQEILAPTHAEPGCKAYELYASDTSGRFYLYEWWKSKHALEKHAASPHFQKLTKAIAGLLDGELEVNLVQRVE